MHMECILYYNIMKLSLWHYQQNVGLVIERSRVRLLARHRHVITLVKLLTPVCLCHQAV